MNKWTEEDLIYLAGYLDGEGCFWIYKSKIGISCANTHRPTIEWLQRTFGGSIRAETRQKKINHRRIYSWQIVSKDAAAVCAAVVPYLKEKAPQAALLLAMRNLMQSRANWRKRVPPELKEERERLTNILKGMKHVPW